jgi:glycosyltransferase involved in cell wall biosynthesis
VPCYGYGRYLPDCLAGIFAQQGDFDLEVIAVDDASPDNSGEILRNCGDPRLRVITHEKNQGSLAAVAHGMEAARGKYLARIDPDDRYHPNFLSTLVPLLEEYPEVGMAYGNAAIIDENGVQTWPGCDGVHGGRDFKGNELIALLEDHFICAPTALGRTEAWRRAMPIPEHLAFNDVWFNWMIAREWEFYYKNVVVADYRVHSANWHGRIILDGSEEKSIFWLLDQIYAKPEKTPELERAKQQARRRIYGAQWLMTARKYFGADMEADAWRCFLRAFRSDPRTFFMKGVPRHFLGTLLGLKRYEALQAAVKRWRPS